MSNDGEKQGVWLCLGPLVLLMCALQHPHYSGVTERAIQLVAIKLHFSVDCSLCLPLLSSARNDPRSTPVFNTARDSAMTVPDHLL